MWLCGRHEALACGQEFFLDSDELIMQLWSLKNATEWTPAGKVGVCGRVHDFTLLNIVRTQTNLIVTMSPPCQSWSREGSLQASEMIMVSHFLKHSKLQQHCNRQ